MFDILSVCKEGKWGNNCTMNCTCQNSVSCSHVNGTCECKTGWMGGNCTEDINECNNYSLFTCPEFSTCSNTDGSYVCQCETGYIRTGQGCSSKTFCFPVLPLSYTLHQYRPDACYY